MTINNLLLMARGYAVIHLTGLLPFTKCAKISHPPSTQWISDLAAVHIKLWQKQLPVRIVILCHAPSGLCSQFPPPAA